MRSLYLDCGTGISGDMVVAALLDLGADEKKLLGSLESFDEKGFEIKISRVKKAGLDCCDFDVILAEDNHDHDVDYLYGHKGHRQDESDIGHTHDHDHHDGEGHTHDHDHHDGDGHSHEHSHHDGDEHTHEHHGADMHHHDHVHRTFADVCEIIGGLDITDGARALAVRIFEILAQAEAKAHATEVEKVHFHEVGAIDSIVDIVSAAVCFDDLGIEKVYIPRICDGHGSVRCQHGIIPVPVPAVMNIAAANSLPLTITEREGEFVTPTGAAFAAAVMTDKQLPDPIVPVKVGMGAGKRDHEQPGIVRAVLFEE